jgi:hypothetical protein
MQDCAENLDDARELLKLWQRRSRRNQKAHYAMALQLTNQTKSFTTLVAITSAAMSVLAIIYAKYPPPAWGFLILAGLGVGSTALAALQSTRRLAELAARHHSAGVAYGAALRRIAQALALPLPGREKTDSLLTGIREALDAIPESAPEVSPKIWKLTAGHLTPDETTSGES